MPNPETVIINTIRALIDRREDLTEQITVTRDAHLFDDLDLDSLEVAELSATLEDELGSDPYSEGLTPRTVGEVLAFYASAA